MIAWAINKQWVSNLFCEWVSERKIPSIQYNTILRLIHHNWIRHIFGVIIFSFKLFAMAPD